MRVTFKDLATKSYSRLIKEGATESQILNTLSNFYLKEQRILTINESEGKTISRALKLLKRGNVSQGTWIPDTMVQTTKTDVKLMKKINSALHKNSWIGGILNEYQTGKINSYQLHHIVDRYSQNPALYEKEEDIDQVELLVEGYNT